MKLSKLIPFCILLLFNTSCSKKIPPIGQINIIEGFVQDSSDIINAIKNNNIEKVKELLSKNINLKIQNSNGETPLMLASASGNKEIVELICNKYKFNNISKLPEFDWKKPKSYVEVANPILYSYNKYTNYSDEYKSFINYSNDKSFKKSALLFAIENGHTDIAKYLTSEGSDLNIEDSHHNSVLTYALVNSNKEILELLLDNKLIDTRYFSKQSEFDINSIDNTGNTPLMIASLLGDIEIVKYLISKGADINKKNNFGNTALMLTLSNNYNEYFDLTTENQRITIKIENNLVYKNFKSKDLSKSKKIIEILLENKANLNDKNNNDTTTLMLASRNSNKEIFDFLISKGLDIKAVDKLGNNILLYSAIGGNEEIFKYLLSKGFDIDHRNYSNETPILLALKNNKTNLAFYIIDNGAVIENRSISNENALINYISSSLEKKDKELYTYLMSRNLDLNLKTSDGRSALILAVQTGDIELVQELLKRGANIDITNKINQTPIEVSLNNSNLDMFKLLSKNGALLYKNQDGTIKLLEKAISDNKIDFVKEILNRIPLERMSDKSLSNLIIYFSNNDSKGYFEDIFLKEKEEVQYKLLTKLVESSLYNGNQRVLLYLIDKKGIDNLGKYNRSNILTFNRINNTSTVDFLIKKGAIPTNELN